jgi:pilus assembly protein Flp/PilA
MTKRQHQSSCEERGATSVEYALMAALIALVIVGAVTVFGVAVNDLFTVPWP